MKKKLKTVRTRFWITETILCGVRRSRTSVLFTVFLFPVILSCVILVFSLLSRVYNVYNE